MLGEVVGMNEIGVDSISFCMFLDEEGDDVIGRTEMEVSVVVDGAGGGDNGVVDGIGGVTLVVVSSTSAAGF